MRNNRRIFPFISNRLTSEFWTEEPWRHLRSNSLWRLWRQWRRMSAAVPHLPACIRFLSAAVSLLPAAIVAWRQPTPYFPQPQAPLLRLPAVKRHNPAPSTPVPAVNNGGSSAKQGSVRFINNKDLRPTRFER